MKQVTVAVKKDFIESISTAKPIESLAELIWNGFDAGANSVQVFISKNEADGISEIRVRDYGYGINPAFAEEFFGSLGDSWKKTRRKENGRALHGKNGKGRFKAFALGERVAWNTSFSKNGRTVTFTISGSANALDKFVATDPVDADGATAGTEVHISNISKDFRSLEDESAILALAKIFAPYLTEYPSVSLAYNGTKVDPRSVQTHRSDYHLGDVELSPGVSVPVAVSVIEWNTKTDREIHLCDADGVSLHTLPSTGIRAPGFNFTAYVKADHFRELDKTNSLLLSDLDPAIIRIVDAAKGRIKRHFRERILEDQGKVVDRWKKEDIYPYADTQPRDPVELAERQVFDILAVNVQNYLPAFENADHKAKKFTFRLLAQAVRDNPESVQLILGEVLGLKKEEQDDLAILLKKTSLSSIISAATIVTNRLNFLLALENLVYDKETKKSLLERDQLHKILDEEAWIFGESYALAGSELRLDEVLQKHLAKLGNRQDEVDPESSLDSDSLRVDLMLHKAIQVRPGEFDYLVVELKRPSQKIDLDVLTQVKKYATAVKNDERFSGVRVNWTFLAVSTDLDQHAKSETNQRNRAPGIAWDDEGIVILAKSWADVINDARTKLTFFSEQLAFKADRDGAKEYLQKAHARFIPDSYLGVVEDPAASDNSAVERD